MPHSIESIKAALRATDLDTLSSEQGGVNAFVFLLNSEDPESERLLGQSLDLLANHIDRSRLRLIQQVFPSHLHADLQSKLSRAVGQWAFMKFYEFARVENEFAVSEILNRLTAESFGLQAIVALIQQKEALRSYHGGLQRKTKPSQREIVKKEFCEELLRHIKNVTDATNEEAIARAIVELTLYLHVKQGLNTENPDHKESRKLWLETIVAGLNSALKKAIDPILKAFGVIDAINHAERNKSDKNADLLIRLRSTPALLAQFIRRKPQQVREALSHLIERKNIYLPQIIQTICDIKGLAAERHKLFGSAKNSILLAALLKKDLPVVTALSNNLVIPGVLPEDAAAGVFLQDGVTIIGQHLSAAFDEEAIACYKPVFDAALLCVAFNQRVTFFENELAVVLKATQLSTGEMEGDPKYLDSYPLSDESASVAVRHILELLNQSTISPSVKVAIILGKKTDFLARMLTTSISPRELLPFLLGNTSSMDMATIRLLVQHVIARGEDDSTNSIRLTDLMGSVQRQTVVLQFPENQKWLGLARDFSALVDRSSSLDSVDFLETLNDEQLFTSVFDLGMRNAILVNAHLTEANDAESVKALLDNPLARKAVTDAFNLLEPSAGLLSALQVYVASFHDKEIFELLENCSHLTISGLIALKRAKEDVYIPDGPGRFMFVKAAYHFSVPKDGALPTSPQEKVRRDFHQQLTAISENWSKGSHDDWFHQTCRVLLSVCALDTWALSAAQWGSLQPLVNYTMTPTFLSHQLKKALKAQVEDAEDPVAGGGAAVRGSNLSVKELLFIYAMQPYEGTVFTKKTEPRELVAAASQDIKDFAKMAETAVALRTLIQKYKSEANHVIKQEVAEILLEHLLDCLKEGAFTSDRVAFRRLHLAISVLKTAQVPESGQTLWQEAQKGIASSLKRVMTSLEKMVEGESHDVETLFAEAERVYAGSHYIGALIRHGLTSLQESVEAGSAAASESDSDSEAKQAAGSDSGNESAEADEKTRQFIQALLANPRGSALQFALDLFVNDTTLRTEGLRVHSVLSDSVQHVTLLHLSKMSDLPEDRKRVYFAEGIKAANENPDLYFAKAPVFASTPILRAEVIQEFGFEAMLKLIVSQRDDSERLEGIFKGLSHWSNNLQKDLLQLFLKSIQYWKDTYQCDVAEQLVKIVQEGETANDRKPFACVMNWFVAQCREVSAGADEKATAQDFARKAFAYVSFVADVLGAENEALVQYLLHHSTSPAFTAELLELFVRSNDSKITSLVRYMQDAVKKYASLSQLQILSELRRKIKVRLKQLQTTKTLEEEGVCKDIIGQLNALIEGALSLESGAVAVESKADEGGGGAKADEPSSAEEERKLLLKLFQALVAVAIDSDMSASIREIVNDGLRRLPVDSIVDQLSQVRLDPRRPQTSVATLVLKSLAGLWDEFIKTSTDDRIAQNALQDMITRFPLAVDFILDNGNQFPLAVIGSRISGLTALHRAAREHDLPKIKMILERLCTPDQVADLLAMTGRDDRDNALYYAVTTPVAEGKEHQQLVDVVKYLMSVILSDKLTAAQQVDLLLTTAEMGKSREREMAAFKNGNLTDQDRLDIESDMAAVNIFENRDVQSAVGEYVIALFKLAATVSGEKGDRLLTALSSLITPDSSAKDTMYYTLASVYVRLQSKLAESGYPIEERIRKILEVMGSDNDMLHSQLYVALKRVLVSEHCYDEESFAVDSEVLAGCRELYEHMDVPSVDVMFGLLPDEDKDTFIRSLAISGEIELLRQIGNVLQPQEEAQAGEVAARSEELGGGAAADDADDEIDLDAEAAAGGSVSKVNPLRQLCQAAISYAELRQLQKTYRAREGKLGFDDKARAKLRFCDKFLPLLQNIVSPAQILNGEEIKQAFTTLASVLFEFEATEQGEYMLVADGTKMKPVLDALYSNFCQLDEAEIDSKLAEMNKMGMDEQVLFVAQVARMNPTFLVKVLQMDVGLAAWHHAYLTRHSLYKMLLSRVFKYCPHFVNLRNSAVSEGRSLAQIASDEGRIDEILAGLPESDLYRALKNEPRSKTLLQEVVQSGDVAAISLVVLALFRLGDMTHIVELLNGTDDDSPIKSDAVIRAMSSDAHILVVRRLMSHAVTRPELSDLLKSLAPLADLANHPQTPGRDELSRFWRVINFFNSAAESGLKSAALKVISTQPQQVPQKGLRGLTYAIDMTEVHEAYADFAWRLFLASHRQTDYVGQSAVEVGFDEIESAPYTEQIAQLIADDVAAAAADRIKWLCRFACNNGRESLLPLAKDALYRAQGLDDDTRGNLLSVFHIAKMLLAMGEYKEEAKAVSYYFLSLQAHLEVMHRADNFESTANRLSLMLAIATGLTKQESFFSKKNNVFVELCDCFPTDERIVSAEIQQIQTLDSSFVFPLVCFVEKQYPALLRTILDSEQAITACGEALKQSAKHVLQIIFTENVALPWEQKIKVLMQDSSSFAQLKDQDLLDALDHVVNKSESIDSDTLEAIVEAAKPITRSAALKKCCLLAEGILQLAGHAELVACLKGAFGKGYAGQWNRAAEIKRALPEALAGLDDKTSGLEIVEHLKKAFPLKAQAQVAAVSVLAGAEGNGNGGGAAVLAAVREAAAASAAGRR